MNNIYNTVFLITVLCTSALAVLVQPDWKIYYNLTTNQTIDTITSSNPRLKLYRQFAKFLRIGFGPIPCSCQELSCGCCAGMDIQMFNFNQRACMNFTYDPQDFAINMNMYMNDKSMYNTSLSGKNPPPACVPIPVPYIPTVDFCVRFFNIHTPGYNIFMCIDFETRMERAPLLILHFDCFQMGQDGISYHKPEDADLMPEGEIPAQQEDEQITEVYDDVSEDSFGNGTMDIGTVPVNGTETIENVKDISSPNAIKIRKEIEMGNLATTVAQPTAAAVTGIPLDRQ